MNTYGRRTMNPSLRSRFKGLALTGVATAIMGMSSGGLAQEQGVEELEEIVVTGIRSSLESALAEKRASDNLVEVIIAEDIGKLPDQNLAEVLENVTGVQITRTAGVGTGVQIRGSSSNRVEINGVSTVGSGGGRTGINFQDVNASIIAAVEVTKASEAKTVEGSVGGTVNLRTIRPLDLKEPLATIRVQGEDSSLSVESIKPRLSGAWGNNWTTDAGDFGVVISGSYTEQEAVSFRPRADRDAIGSAPGAAFDEYLGIQFLLQEQENDDYETTNLAGTFEWAPSDNLKFHFDAIINEQERSRDQYRVQASGVSTLINISAPTAFEIVDFGVGPGTFPAALSGFLEPNLDNDDDDPNLRFTTETNSRVTDTDIFTLGGEWQGESLSAKFEISSANSDSATPFLNSTLNFINPNCPLDGTSNDNCVPFVYDLSGNQLSFGINFDSPFAPTTADLLNPANVVLDQVQVGRTFQENTDESVRVDLSYDFGGGVISSVDFGVRLNESSSTFSNFNDNIGGFSRMVDSPNGLLFADLLVAGPNNFGDGDGRDLFVQNFLLVDPDRSFSDPEGTLAILQNAVIAHDPNSPDILDLSFNEDSFYDVSEETTALYAQANFEYGIFRGNFGLRYVDTEIDSVAFGPEDANGVRSLQSSKGDYDFILPRLNIVANVTDDVILRFGYGSDINRPSFNNLNTGFTFSSNENTTVALGNPGLEPEEVDSFDISAEWYFAPSAVASIGYFSKDRTNIFGTNTVSALLTPDGSGGFVRETDSNCPGGGIFNPIVVPNVLGDPNQLGLCVDFTIPGNDPDTTTQSGVELAFQYDLSEFEDNLGWASGFGFIANATFQDFDGGSIIDTTSGRGLNVLGDVSLERGLLDFSETAYNFTMFYEKYGFSARARYTWREGFRNTDFAGGASTSSTFSFPVYTLDRGQLNASLSYDINDNFNIGVEVTNLTEEGVEQRCVSETGPLCFVGIPDRRITFGGSYRF